MSDVNDQGFLSERCPCNSTFLFSSFLWNNFFSFSFAAFFSFSIPCILKHTKGPDLLSSLCFSPWVFLPAPWHHHDINGITSMLETLGPTQTDSLVWSEAPNAYWTSLSVSPVGSLKPLPKLNSLPTLILLLCSLIMYSYTHNDPNHRSKLCLHSVQVWSQAKDREVLQDLSQRYAEAWEEPKDRVFLGRTAAPLGLRQLSQR